MKTSNIAALLFLSVLFFSAYPLLDAETIQAVSGYSVVCVFIIAHASSEIKESPKLSDNVQNGAAESEDLVETRKRILKAVLAPAILAQLAERRFLSATNIISVFKKRWNIQLSSGTVYPVLYALERDGTIKRLPNRRKKLYVLTSKGKETIKNMQGNTEELNKMINELLG
jgi:DNA-binding PadR family transcriptional regulator